MKIKTCHQISRWAIARAIAAAFYRTSPAVAVTPATTGPVQFPEEIVPSGAAVVVAFANTVTFKAESGPVYPESGVLLQPLFDNYQQAVVPAGTPVMALFYPSVQGVAIEAHALVFGGKVVPIQASSSFLPGTTMSAPDTSVPAQPDTENIDLSQVNANTSYILTLGTEIPLDSHGAPLLF